MTAGRHLLPSIRWPGARSRSDSGAEADIKERAKKPVWRDKKSTFSALSSMLSFEGSENEKLVKITWRVKDFMQKITNCGEDGINSKNIKIRLNDVTTTWNASLRLWTNEAGKKIFNPFLFCCNLVSVEGAGRTRVGLAVEVRLREGPDYQLLSHLLTTDVSLVAGSPLQSLAATSVRLDNNILQAGDVVFQVRLRFTSSPGPTRELYLADCGQAPDIILLSGAAQFEAHKHKLASASAVFATMISDQVQCEVDDNNNDKDGHGLPSRDRIIVEEIEEEILKKILQFIYTGSTSPADLSLHCVKLLKAASLYQIASLKADCEKMLTRQLAPDRVSSSLLLADITNSHNLKLSALKYCKLYKEYIYKDADWHRMEDERPWLYSEVVSWVAPDTCEDHLTCVQSSNRYSNYRDLVTRDGGSQGINSTNSCDKIECHPM